MRIPDGFLSLSVGGAWTAIVLGPLAATLAMAYVLAAPCFLFHEGSLAAGSFGILMVRGLSWAAPRVSAKQS